MVLSYLASKQGDKGEVDPATGGNTERRKKGLLAQDLGGWGSGEYLTISTQGADQDGGVSENLPDYFQRFDRDSYSQVISEQAEDDNQKPIIIKDSSSDGFVLFDLFPKSHQRRNPNIRIQDEFAEAATEQSSTKIGHEVLVITL